MMEGDCVCVVGSGPTGVMAASTLIDAGVPVVMLEAGDSYPRRCHVRIRGVDVFRPVPPAVREPVADIDFVNPDHSSARWIKSHCLGGLSNYWSGITLRYAPGDFTDGDRLHGMYRWPIGYEDLEPYYRRVERVVQVRGATADFETLPACQVAYERQVGPEWAGFAHACAGHGRSLTVIPDANGPATVFSTAGTPQNFALRVLRKLQTSDRFRLIANAQVTRVLLNGSSPAARGVEYVDARSGTYETISAKAVVLAAGPLSSTQILLNSQSKSFPHGLGNSQGVLGRYLHDHPLEYSQVEGDFRFRRLDDRRRGGLYVTRESYSGSEPLRATAFLLYGGTIWSMLPFLLLLRHRYYFKLLKRMIAARHDSAARGIASLNGSMLYACCFGTQIPCYENHVSLDPEKKDRFGVPLLQIQTRFSQAEIESMKKSASFVPTLLKSVGSRVLQVSSELQTQGTSVHYGGTVRMHASPKHGVVDGWNRLHDVRNVLVVDASCFTTCVEKNPSLTAAAISMRAAERLAAERGN